MINKRRINSFGNILMLFSFAFIINRILEYNINISRYLNARMTIILLMAAFIYSFIVLVLAQMFRRLLESYIDREVSESNTTFLYCRSNLYKYLPGNILHYIGRTQIAFVENISHGDVISVSLLEVCLLVLSAALVTMTLSARYVIMLSEHIYIDSYSKIIFIFFLIIISAVLIYRFVDPTRQLSTTKLSKLIIPMDYKLILEVVVVYIFSFILNGVIFGIVLFNLNGNYNWDLILPLIGVYSFSWIIGFVTPGAPGGLGIREAIMSMLMAGVLGSEIVITAVILYRLVTILGDILGYAESFLFLNMVNK